MPPPGARYRSLFQACLGLLIASAASGVATELPEPRTPDSHRAYVEFLFDSQTEMASRLLRLYDDHLAARPGDHATHVERCRFLANAGCDADGVCPYWEEHRQCLREIEERFPGIVGVELYLLELSWGDEAIERGKQLLLGDPSSWRNRDRATVAAKLAEVYDHTGPPADALEYSRLAMQRDPARDLSLIAARALVALARPEDALDELRARLSQPSGYWIRLEKVRQLLALGAATEAALVLTHLKPPEGVEADHLLAADVWRAVNRVDDARAALAAAEAADGNGWRLGPIRFRRLQLELEFGDQESSVAAYRSLREMGLEGDPFATERIRLAFHHPLAPWDTGDLGRMGLLLVLLLFLAALPGLIVLPVHHVGLVRDARHPLHPHPVTRWKLRHTWYVLSLVNLSSAPLLLWGGAGRSNVLQLILSQPAFALEQTELSAEALATSLFVAQLVIAIGLALVVRRRDAPLLGPGRWSVTRTLLTTVGCVFALRLLTVPFALLAQASDGAASLPMVTSWTTSTLAAVVDVYGEGALLLALVLFAPLLEELLFRGVVLQGFTRHVGGHWANALQATLFALSHEEWRLYPFYVCFGIMLGLLTQRSRSLLAPVLVHAGNNAIAFLVLTGRTPFA